MSPLQTLRNWWSRSRVRVEYESEDSADRVTASISEIRALNLAQLWRAVSILSRDVSNLPMMLYRWDQEEGTREVARNLSAYKLLAQDANPFTTAHQFIQTLTYHAVLKGNGYAWIARDLSDARPTALYVLNPDRVVPVIETMGSTFDTVVPGVSRVYYVYTHPDGFQQSIDSGEILHIRNLSGNALEGYPVLSLAARSMALTEESRDYGLAFFKNSARPNLVLVHPGRLNPKARSNLERHWKQQHEGTAKAHRTAILYEGIDIKELSINARDAQLLETRQHQARETAQWVGIPSHLLGDDAKVSYNSLEQENQSYLRQSLDPWLVTWEKEAGAKLLTSRQRASDSYYFEFDRTKLIRADLASRYSSYSTAIASGWLSPDEVRARENLNPIEGGLGEVYYRPSGASPASLDEPEPEPEPPSEPEPGGPPPSSSEPEPGAEPLENSSELVSELRSILASSLARLIESGVRTGNRRRRSSPKVYQTYLEQELPAIYGPEVYRAIMPLARSAGLAKGSGDPVAWAEAIEDRLYEAVRRALADTLAEEQIENLAEEIATESFL